MVTTRSLAARARPVTKIVNPNTIISGPKRLAGRCHHAIRPQPTYAEVSHPKRSASTKGLAASPAMAPLFGWNVAARLTETTLAAQPTSAIDHTTDGLGAHAVAVPCGPAIIDAPITCSRRCSVDGLAVRPRSRVAGSRRAEHR